MPRALPRKFRLMFIIQMLLITVFIAAIVWLMVSGTKQIVFKGLLKEDAAYFWEQRQRDPLTVPTHSRRQEGTLLHRDDRGQLGTPLDPSYLALSPGFHDLPDAGWLVWVEDGPEGRLFLRYDREHAQRIIAATVLVPATIALLGFYFAAWFSYRRARRLVMPVSWLATQVSQWDPRHPGGSLLDDGPLPDNLRGETRLLAQALVSMAQRVRDHIQREHEFTRDASHELRTPLTVIRMAADVGLAHQDLTRQQVRTLRRIQQAGKDMEAVLESQLILARDAEVETPLESVLLARVLDDEVDQAQDGLDGRPLVIQLAVDDPELRVETSERALRVVIRHLLGNACMYTLDGRIQVRLLEGWVEVIDTGIGMNREQINRAFEPFYRANPSDGGGSGLGLSIVRRLCKRFDWPLELHSEPDRGTKVRVGVAVKWPMSDGQV